MNLQRSDFKLLRFILRKIPLITVGLLLVVASCKNNIEEINAFADKLEIPNQSGTNIIAEYTDTGKLQVRFFTPELKHFMRKDDPYYEFPKGIEVHIYNKDEKLQSIITAKYSILKESTQIWEARDSVVARNILTGEQIESEQMFWDQPNKFIYSNVFTKVTNPDGVYFGEKGFEASQDLSYYRLIGSSGKFRVKNEEQTPD